MGVFLWMLLSIAIISLTLLALFDILNRSFKNNNTRTGWVLLILFLPLAGPLCYLLLSGRQRNNPGNDVELPGSP